MPTRRSKNSSETTTSLGGYAELLAGIKQRVSGARVRAHLAVSRELNLLYWQIGRDIVIRQKHEGWGKAVVERLSADIQKDFPGIEGFSGLNIWRMRAFYRAWEMPVGILSQPVTEIGSECPPSEILAQPVTELSPPIAHTPDSLILAQPATELPPQEIIRIPWSHNIILVQKIKDPALDDLHPDLRAD